MVSHKQPEETYPFTKRQQTVHNLTGEHADDGLCFVQPCLQDGVTSGRASATEVGQAAWTLFHKCSIEFGVGGIAGNIGGDNNLDVAFASYSPNVRCDRSSLKGPSWDSCMHIWADMETSRDPQVFGRSGDPRVQVALPVTLDASRSFGAIFDYFIH